MKSKLIALGILAAIALPPAAAVAADNDSDMLEHMLSSVVTVAVYKGDDLKKPFGFGATDAYEHLLDLSGAMASGSGFCIERNGKKYIVTNCHVVEEASNDEGSIAVFGIGQTKYPMKIVGADSFIDIAVLEFKDKQPGDEILPVKFSADAPRLGEKVFAIGNPYGEYPYSISDGIIGGLNRVRGGLTGKFGYLESTATVAWGNSGGPLVNEKGDVVGINTGIEIRERFQQMIIQPQINFALESSVANHAVDEIIADGHVRRAFLGVLFSQDFQVKKVDKGEQILDIGATPVIGDVLPDSPGAGVLDQWKGATVKKVNGQDVRNIEEVLSVLEGIKPGDDCTLDLELNGKADKVTVKTKEMTRELMASWAQHIMMNLGLDVKSTNDGLTIRRTDTAAAPVDDHTPAAPVPAHNPAVPTGPGAGPQTPPSGHDRFKQFDYNNRQSGFHRPAQPAQPADLPLVALGTFNDDGTAAELWRTSNLQELGVALRLAALAGRVDLACKGEGDKYNVLRTWLSGTEGKLSQSLLY